MAAKLQPTPGQSLGPFQHPAGSREYLDTDVLALPSAEGQHIRVRGRVTNCEGEPVPGAVLELWQATSTGRYAHPKDPATTGRLDPGVRHYIRVRAGANGEYSFSTVKPGGYPVPLSGNAEWVRPPHIHYRVYAPGYQELVTQVYFDREADNETDRLQLLLTPEQRKQLRMVPTPDGQYEFNPALSTTGYPGPPHRWRPWDAGLAVSKEYGEATAKL
eukprot:TRINITY_DN15436_c0_g2_i1.p1 TRINITY_DN15436_c0_g2~~TRINITY_DN15436_c0_g2_i1.p1  ORF type:complete len:247 (+),score=76.31 TRINITY_DN15436_c0_g2_i1:92-742(+)